MTVRQVIDISPNTPYYQLNAYSIGGVMSTFLYVRGLFVGLYLMVSLVVCHVLQIISFIVYPFSPKICRTLNRYIVGVWWGLVAWSMERVIKIVIHVTGDELPMYENAILIPNHQASADIPVLLCLALQKGMIGNLKWFVKDDLKHMPFIGWGLRLLGCPFVKRNKQDSKENLMQLFDVYKDDAVPIWMISFLEGTRTNAAKLAADRAKTEEDKKIPLMHHMYPKRTGFIVTVQGLRAHVSAIYDVEILYHQFKPSVGDLLNGKSRAITLHITRTPIEEIPLDDDGIYAWVVKSFHRKDEIYTQFYHL